MRIACVGYRHWALEIYDQLASKTDHVFLIFRSKAQYKEEVLYDFKPDLVLFYGWSWRTVKMIGAIFIMSQCKDRLSLLI